MLIVHQLSVFKLVINVEVRYVETLQLQELSLDGFGRTVAFPACICDRVNDDARGGLAWKELV